MNNSQIMAYLKDLVHQVGKIILAAHDKAEENIETKAGTANFVTAYDVAVQEHLIKRLGSYIPDAVFIAEEQENDTSMLMQEHCFIIDPIDGTTNFIHDYKVSCVSIAMASHGEVVLGVVYDPYRNELFWAEKGKGAYLNGAPIRVSSRPMALAVVSYGTSPYYKETLADKTFSLARDVFVAAADVRRSGSAAIDLAHFAAGRTDAFFELILSPWDYAAGALIVNEAGGKITQAGGADVDLLRPCSVFAGNDQTYPALIELAAKYCN